MTKITLDDKEYDTADLTDEQNQTVNILNVGTNSIAMLDHITQCVKVVQQLKANELKKSLGDDNQEELDL
tara:strand:+ start:768 stop:977 length:210 start_codon:yes stop_codon:yes gene_type:complete